MWCNVKHSKKRCKENLFLRVMNNINFNGEQSLIQHYNGSMNVVCKNCKSLNFSEEQPNDRDFQMLS